MPCGHSTVQRRHIRSYDGRPPARYIAWARAAALFLATAAAVARRGSWAASMEAGPSYIGQPPVVCGPPTSDLRLCIAWLAPARPACTAASRLLVTHALRSTRRRRGTACPPRGMPKWASNDVRHPSAGERGGRGCGARQRSHAGRPSSPLTRSGIGLPTAIGAGPAAEPRRRRRYAPRRNPSGEPSGGYCDRKHGH